MAAQDAPNARANSSSRSGSVGGLLMLRTFRSCAERPSQRPGEGPRIERVLRWPARLQGSVRLAFAVFRWPTGSEARTISRRAVSPILWPDRVGLGMRAISFCYISAALNECQALRQFRQLLRCAITQSAARRAAHYALRCVRSTVMREIRNRPPGGVTQWLRADV